MLDLAQTPCHKPAERKVSNPAPVQVVSSAIPGMAVWPLSWAITLTAAIERSVKIIVSRRSLGRVELGNESSRIRISGPIYSGIPPELQKWPEGGRGCGTTAENTAQGSTDDCPSLIEA